MSRPPLDYQDASSDNFSQSLAGLELGTSQYYQATPTSEESREDQFDSRYAVADKPSRFFNIGRVFKTLWIEPAGGTVKNDDRKSYHTVGFGHLSYAKVRRFVVIRKRLHSCLCLMISTYGAQGALKESARSEDHAVVYSSQGPEPSPLPEERIVLGAFPIIIEETGEDLGTMSRLDFGKVYTVEHNVKVLRIGRVLPDQIKRLEGCFAGRMGFPPPTLDSDPSPLNSSDVVLPAAKLDTKAGPNGTTSSQRGGLARKIKGSPGEVEEIDKGYRVTSKDYKAFFRVGRVFSTLWTDPLGSTNSERSDATFVSRIVNRENIYSTIRRFVIVRQGDRSCTCLPVTSYAGAGHRKAGIRLDEHGFIYSKTPPRKVDGMLQKPLRILTSRGVSFHDPSLINYGKVYTVETNVKVKDVGLLDEGSQKILGQYFREVFLGTSGAGGTSSESTLNTQEVTAAFDPGLYDVTAAYIDPGLYDVPSLSPWSSSQQSVGVIEYQPTLFMSTAASPDDPSTTYQSFFPSTSPAGFCVSYDSDGRGNRSYQPRAFGDPSYSQSFSYPPPSADKTHGPPSVPAGGYPPAMSYTESASGYASQTFDNFLPTVAQSSRQIEYATAGDGGDADDEEEIRLQTLDEARNIRKSRREKRSHW